MSFSELQASAIAQKHLLTLMRGSRLGRQEAHEFLRLLLGSKLGRRNVFSCGALLCLLMKDELLDIDTLMGLDDALLTFTRETLRAEVPGRTVAAIVGSGKDEYKTFNVSTCAAVVAASCGVYIAKVGCGAESSVAGTTDILQAVGLETGMPFSSSLATLKRTGFAVFEAESILPDLFDLYIGRSSVFTALEFVLPAYIGVNVDIVVYGLANERTELASEILRRHGQRGLIVSGLTNEGLRFDELSVLGKSKVSRITNDSIETFELYPEDMGLPLCHDEDVKAATHLDAAVSLVRRILRGGGNVAQNAMVAANAGALLWATGHTRSISEGAAISLEAVRSGQGWDFLTNHKSAKNQAKEGKR